MQRPGRWAPVALLVAALGYATWLLSYVLPVKVGTLNGYVSELPAKGQPFRWVFGSGDLVAGALVAVVAIALWLTGRGRNDKAGTVAWVALAVFGVFTVADVLFPLDCAPSVSAACRAAEHAGTVSVVHRIHAGTSVVTNLAVLVHMVVVAVTERRTPGRWSVLGRFAVPLAAVNVGATLAVVILVLVGSGVGIPQRLSVLCVSAWLALLALTLARGLRPAARRRLR